MWTDPRLFSLFVTDPRDTPADSPGRPPLWDAVDAMLESALALGGGVEYCHGLGSKLGPWATREWGDALVLARLLKRAADPEGILNPGKLGL